MKIETKELSPSLWPTSESLLGKQGARGAWGCMWWRVPRGGKLWDKTKGAPAKRGLRKLVASGHALGVLAFVDGEPVDWCSLGPRVDFPRLERVRRRLRGT